MSPEEFDNRLKSAFQDEYLQPKEQLWGNISSQLVPVAKTPFWYWLLPAIVAVAVAVVWVGNQTPQKHETAIETNIEPASVSNAETEQLAINTMNDRNETIAINERNEIQAIDQSSNASSTSVEAPKQTQYNKQIKKSSKSKTTQPESTNFWGSFVNQNSNSIGQSAKSNTNSIAETEGLGDFDMLNFFNFAWFPNFFKPYTLEELYSVDLKAKNTTIHHNTNSNKPPKTSDFSSKRWFTLGLGPQLAINTIKMNQDSQAWVHKQLWDNKDRLTSNGSGFQAFGHLALKFGKNNRYIFETGLNYSLRTEEIKLNESSYDIAARDNNGKINQYTQILLKVIYGTDTTYYLAVTNFSLAVNNKYHILTVPFRLSAEHKISESTFMSYGLGGGFSMLSSHNTEHLNMIWGNSVKERNSTQFSASLNANLSLYTNFNDIGQIGVYTGLQMYLNPWKVNSNQYAINMRDMQLGITFRKPF